MESEFNVHLTEPESNVVRSISKLEKELLSLDDELALDDSLLPRHVLRSPGHQTTRPAGRVRGAAARPGAPAGVGAVADMAAAEAGADANKRSSTTGASMEWPHGLCKTIKKDGEDSPRMGSATARGKARRSTASSRAQSPRERRAPRRRLRFSRRRCTWADPTPRRWVVGGAPSRSLAVGCP